MPRHRKARQRLADGNLGKLQPRQFYPHTCGPRQRCAPSVGPTGNTPGPRGLAWARRPPPQAGPPHRNCWAARNRTFGMRWAIIACRPLSGAGDRAPIVHNALPPRRSPPTVQQPGELAGAWVAPEPAAHHPTAVTRAAIRAATSTLAMSLRTNGRGPTLPCRSAQPRCCGGGLGGLVNHPVGATIGTNDSVIAPPLAPAPIAPTPPSGAGYRRSANPLGPQPPGY